MFVKQVNEIDAQQILPLPAEDVAVSHALPTNTLPADDLPNIFSLATNIQNVRPKAQTADFKTSLLQIDYTLPIVLEIPKNELSVYQEGRLVGEIAMDGLHMKPNGGSLNIWRLYNEANEVSITAHCTGFGSTENPTWPNYANSLGMFYFFGKGGPEAFQSEPYMWIEWAKYHDGQNRILHGSMTPVVDILIDYPNVVWTRQNTWWPERPKKNGLTFRDHQNNNVIARVTQDDNNWNLTIYDTDKISIDILIFTVIAHKYY